MATQKFRKAFHEIEKVLGADMAVVILLGLRKTGKTTILKQLAEKYGGYYVDFRASPDPVNDYLDIYEREEKLILLDEIGYLPAYDAYFGNLEKDIRTAGKKIVITSSSYGTLKQQASEQLGGGRSYPVEIFPLCFEEYLYFTDKISGYGERYEPSEQDLQDFYRLKNVPEGMEFIINREYLRTVFIDAEAAHENAQAAVRDISLDRSYYASVLDIIAYTLNDKISLKRFRGMQVGAQELGKDVKGLPISKSLISLANNIVSGITNGLFENVGIKELARIVAYLYQNGFIYVDLARNENGIQPIDRVRHELAFITTADDFEQILSRYTFSVISPLLYTRLMVDLEDIAGKLCTGSVYGRLYELTVKSELIYKNGYDTEHFSYKYAENPIEVDLWQNNLLLEATVRHKSDREHSVDKVALNYKVIRILTDEAGEYSFNGTYYRIGYPKALLMLSNSDIFDLESRKAIEIP